MSASATKSFHFSAPSKLQEDATKVIEKQGIVSILGYDCHQTKVTSLRRTLSANMSSKKWLAQNGFSPIKMIASSEQIVISAADSSSMSEEEKEEEEEYEGKNEFNGRGHADVWGSILSQKAKEDSSKLPPIYVHPLVKRSASSMSEKSLEICTESLGSETGSIGFSSYQSSHTGDVDEDEQQQQQQQQQQQKELQSFDNEEIRGVKYNYSANKKLPPRSFPPPLPSLTPSVGPSLHMHSHRTNGRLVLEAVSTQSNNFFQAQRQDGRILLTLLNSPSEEPNHETKIDQEEDKVEEFEDVFEIFEEEEEEEEEIEAKNYDDDGEEVEMAEEEVEKENPTKEVELVKERALKVPSGVIHVHRSALMMKKLQDNRNPTWPHKLIKNVNLVYAEADEETTPLPQSLPPPPRVARLIPSSPSASFNAYDYFWRTKPAAVDLINPLTCRYPPLKNKSNRLKTYERQELVVLLSGCKEPRRSLLIW